MIPLTVRPEHDSRFDGPTHRGQRSNTADMSNDVCGIEKPVGRERLAIEVKGHSDTATPTGPKYRIVSKSHDNHVCSHDLHADQSCDNHMILTCSVPLTFERRGGRVSGLAVEGTREGAARISFFFPPTEEEWRREGGREGEREGGTKGGRMERSSGQYIDHL